MGFGESDKKKVFLTFCNYLGSDLGRKLIGRNGYGKNLERKLKRKEFEWCFMKIGGRVGSVHWHIGSTKHR